MRIYMGVAESDAVDLMRTIGKSRLPDEACGLFIPPWCLVELPNRSDSPTKEYVVDREDVAAALDELHVSWSENVTVWHTHPSGSVGPSKGDLVGRLEGLKYLVVALPGGEAARY